MTNTIEFRVIFLYFCGMYYRRKILLGLLEAFDNKLDKISLQKLLMLLSRLQPTPDFHFVPYKFGCFSFQANADLSTMVKYNQVAVEGKCWVKTDKSNYLSMLKEKDKTAIQLLKHNHGTKNADALIKYSYVTYPYLAINSTIAKDILNKEEYANVVESRPISQTTTLFTIGYEGISLEEYLNKLIKYDVKVLCDVRKNSLSMKYGFSKSQLQNACEGVGIEYVHIPELGIESDKRQVLTSQADYDRLFIYYKKTILCDKTNALQRLFEMLQAKKRIALTCFEANIQQCHRKHLAEAITHLEGFTYELKHI